MGMRYRAVAVDPDRLDVGADVEEVMALLESGVDLDKMWHAAQVVIGGSLEASEPLMTGVPFGEDLGFGPLMLASPTDVARVADGLAGLSEESLVARFDPAVMMEQFVYPMVWDEDAGELAVEVASAAMLLVGLYRQAAEDGSAILAAVL